MSGGKSDFILVISSLLPQREGFADPTRCCHLVKTNRRLLNYTLKNLHHTDGQIQGEMFYLCIFFRVKAHLNRYHPSPDQMSLNLDHETVEVINLPKHGEMWGHSSAAPSQSFKPPRRAQNLVMISVLLSSALRKASMILFQ